ncbi:hypothetical protein [Orrella dioscoreae]|uniref:Uncharacterized protein n=1 Tax=Orrella dioscoreae TaxID=1851544 RepID=A0A1C3K1E1_9BURK|nr:hypothetical protein [Orrella dioscoreae]SBT25301.1 hypothetical protein ODI_01616 [Orrella dioscoreae]SOE49075.1 hypothetical protein ODI_R1827 [Orrella dioscoreae]
MAEILAKRLLLQAVHDLTQRSCPTVDSFAAIIDALERVMSAELGTTIHLRVMAKVADLPKGKA